MKVAEYKAANKLNGLAGGLPSNELKQLRRNTRGHVLLSLSLSLSVCLAVYLSVWLSCDSLTEFDSLSRLFKLNQHNFLCQSCRRLLFVHL